MLEDLLEKRKCFKLVCGAGNEDAKEVEALVAIYSKAGCQFFDICAKPEIIDAAKSGIKKANMPTEQYICVSVGISGDPHITKATINKNKCITCEICKESCSHDAINKNFEIIKERCLGCGQCKKNCPQKAISMYSQILNYDLVLPELIKKGIDCIEFHAISENEEEVNEKWEIINSLFDGLLCISLDRSELGDRKLIERVKRLTSTRKPYTTIIQADGIAMSGNDDEYSTTLQAVATAQLFQNSKIPAYIMMSGGTNTKSTILAKMCGINPHCIAVGSFARKIIKDYLKIPDILNNKEKFDEAVKIAKEFIDNSLENMQSD